MQAQIDELIQATTSELLAAMIDLKANKDQSFPDWCLQTIVDGHPFTFERREYLWVPYHDDHPWQVTQKATQLGETIRAVLRAIYAMIVKGYRSVLYYFPNDNDIKRFSKGRAKPLITENPHIAKYITKTDEVHLKQFGSCLLYLLGMGTALSVKSIPANAVFLDEFDEANQAAFDQVLERLGGQMEDDNEIYVHLFSNPTLPDYGVTLEFESTDQKFYLLKCSSCGHYNCLEDMWMDWTGGGGKPPLITLKDGRTIRACGKCGSELNPAKGEWIAKRPSVTDKRGYHYTQLWSQTKWHRPSNILDKYYKAIEKGNLQIFVNQTIGYGYIEAENRLSIEEVLALCGSVGMASASRTPSYMGIDQGKGLHVVIGGKLPGRCAEITHICEYPDTKNAKGETVSAWDEMDRLMKDFNVTRCVVDAKPEIRNARAFAERHKGKVWLYWDNIHQKGGYAWNEKEMNVSCNRTETLDASHAAIKEQKVVTPKNCRPVKEFAKHLHNVGRKLEEEEEMDKKTGLKRKTGSKFYTWVKLGTNHFRFAFNYFCIGWHQSLKGAYGDLEIGG